MCSMLTVQLHVLLSADQTFSELTVQILVVLTAPAWTQHISGVPDVHSGVRIESRCTNVRSKAQRVLSFG